MILIESEKTLEKKMVQEVKKQKGITVKIHPFSFSGFPDRIIFLPNKHVFFAEIKTTKKKPEKLQIICHEKIRKLGFNVYVISSTQDIKNTLKNEGIRTTPLSKKSD